MKQQRKLSMKQRNENTNPELIILIIIESILYIHAEMKKCTVAKKL